MLSFDQVRVKGSAGVSLLSASDYIRMPLQQRVKLISSGASTFLRKGQTVPLRDAIASIRTMS